jgi:hypothetical protein
MQDVIKYLEGSFGLQTKIISLEKSKMDQLPLYIKGNYDFFKASLLNINVLLCEVRDNADPTPDQMQKQGEYLEELVNMPVIFILKRIESWERQRLIQKKVSFIQPFKHLYIPELFFELNDVKKRESLAEKKK